MAIIRNTLTLEVSPSKAHDLREFLDVYDFEYIQREFYGKAKFEVSCSHYERTEILQYIDSI